MPKSHPPKKNIDLNRSSVLWIFESSWF